MQLSKMLACPLTPQPGLDLDDPEAVIDTYVYANYALWWGWQLR